MYTLASTKNHHVCTHELQAGLSLVLDILLGRHSQVAQVTATDCGHCPLSMMERDAADLKCWQVRWDGVFMHAPQNSYLPRS